MTEEHIEYHTIRDDFSSYGVENGPILKVKLSVVDVINLIGENDKEKRNVVTKLYVHVITTSDLERHDIKYEQGAATEKNQVKELKFTSVNKVINIYETAKFFIFADIKVDKIFLTDKVDIANNSLLRHYFTQEVNIIAKSNFINTLNMDARAIS